MDSLDTFIKHPMNVKKDATFPLTLSIYKGVSVLEMIEFAYTLIKCFQDDLKNKTPNHFNLYLWYLCTTYREEQLIQEEPLKHPLAFPILIKTGKPVLGEIDETILNFNEYTRNFCTFENDKKNSNYVMVLDESKLDCHLKDGVYKASVIILPKKIFSEKVDKTWPYLLKKDIQAVLEIKIVIEEYLSPLPQSQVVKKKSPQYSAHYFIPENIQVLIADFKHTFNIK